MSQFYEAGHKECKNKTTWTLFLQKMVRAANIPTNAEDWTQRGTKALEKTQEDPDEV